MRSTNTLLHFLWLVFLIYGAVAVSVEHRKITLKPGEGHKKEIVTIPGTDVSCVFSYEIVGGGTSEDWELLVESHQQVYICNIGRFSGSYLLFKSWRVELTEGSEIAHVFVRDNDNEIPDTYVIDKHGVQSIDKWRGNIAQISVKSHKPKVEL